MPSAQNYFLLTLFFVVLLAFMGWIYYWRPAQQPPSQIPESPPVMPTASSTVSTPANSTTTMKTYTNADFGFEFQYPSNLTVKEKYSVNYYSKFYLQIEYWNKEGKYLDVFDANVVLPEFADRTFLSLDPATSTIVVDGVSGIKYEYEFESLPEVAVVLPLGQYKLILGIDGSAKFYGHQNDFNQILASFKFLK